MTDGDAAKSDLTKQPWKLWHNLGFCFQWQPCNYSIFNMHILVFSWFKNGSSYNGWTSQVELDTVAS